MNCPYTPQRIVDRRVGSTHHIRSVDRITGLQDKCGRWAGCASRSYQAKDGWERESMIIQGVEGGRFRIVLPIPERRKILSQSGYLHYSRFANRI